MSDYHEETEAELSARFDSEIMPMILEQHGKPGIAFANLTTIRLGFNDWADSLADSELITHDQLYSFCYVGRWAE